MSGCKHKPAATAPSIKYQCPMHPQIVQDKPGECPICFMKLVEVKPPSPGSATLSQRERDDASSHPSPSGRGEGEGAIPGQASVAMSPAQQQAIGVQRAQVERRMLVNTLRASARVAYDPSLYSAMLEHQQAVQALVNAPASAATYRRELEQTVQASRLRLKQMGLSEDQIARAGAADSDPSNLLQPRPGEPVWVYADLYDYEAPLVHPGAKALLSSPALGGRTLSGTVRSIDTVINPQSRTLRARISVPNAGGLLKPEMYLTAALQSETGPVLTVPKSAILPTGERSLAFVEGAPGHFDPRLVTLGREGDDRYEVLGGLKEGEMVVVSANFLIDSESKIKAAIEKASGQPPAAGHKH